ncbi:MAG TPA: GIY-YIG nuclease family protein [Burkholderiaceae bacterium]
MQHGFIYALSNPSMLGIFKIGYTLKHPRARMAELTRSTSCPTAFEMLAYFDAEDPAFVEAEIHASLHKYRVNNAREFFKVPPLELQNVFRKWCEPHEGATCFIWLDEMCDYCVKAQRTTVGTTLQES